MAVSFSETSILRPTILAPTRSKRVRISPTMPRSSASGLRRTSDFWIICRQCKEKPSEWQDESLPQTAVMADETDRAVAVGAMDADAAIEQRRQDPRRRVAVAVAGTVGDDGISWPDGIEEGLRTGI